MRPLLLCGFLFALSVARSISAADPSADVDAALRSRIHDFYQLQVNRKFRQAEQLVATDTKDFYYDSRKPDIRAFKVAKIEYAPDFQSAKVTLSSRMQIMIPGAAPKVLDVPFTSYWKIDDGQWCWYVDQSKLLNTPFGRVNAKTDGAKEDVSKLAQRISAAALMDGVRADVKSVHLDPDNPQPQTVTLKNTLPGPVTVQVLTASPALKIAVAKPDLGAEESTQLTITPVVGSPDRRPSQVLLKIGPLGQIIQIGLDYRPAK